LPIFFDGIGKIAFDPEAERRRFEDKMTAEVSVGQDRDGQALAAAFDLRTLPASFYDDPYRTYAALRRHAPVKRLPDGGYFLSRHADCLEVYKDTETFASDKRREFAPKFGSGLLYQHHTTSLVFNDPPLHTRVRRIIAGAFTPRAIADMEAPLVALVDGLLEQLAPKGDVDLIEDFAAAVPIEVIGNLLGVPHGDRDPLRGWSLAILGALEPSLTPDQLQRGERAVAEFLDYLRGLVADRRARPGDPERDVLTRLIIGDRDGQLSESELLHNIIFILNAGHETTTNLIGNGLVLLDRWPEQRARLLAEPSLIRRAVEEVLRYESSNQLGNREVKRDVVLGGVAMPAGSFVTIGIGAANRDEAVFTAAETFDVTREHNPHLAFGSGAHICAGLAIARLEGRIALGRLLQRFPRYAVTGPALRARRARFRGFTSIPARMV
jgi:hypothetical protein